MTTGNSTCGNGGFTIVWNIENFSHCVTQQGSVMTSQKFNIPEFTGTWCVQFYPRGKSDAMVECDLSGGYHSSGRIDCQLCVCTWRGEVLHKNETENVLYSPNTHETKNIAKFERKIFDRLPDDTLVIHCHLWKQSSDRSEIPLHCFTRTCLGVQRRVFYWKVDKFSDLQLRKEKECKLYAMEGQPSLTFTLTLLGTNVEDASVQISVNFLNVQTKTFFTCALFVMSPNGSAKKYMRDEYLLEYGSHLKMFPNFLQRREIVAGDLSEGTLTLRGEVTISGDNQSVEHVVYGLQTREAMLATTSAISGPLSDPRPSALSSDMSALFEGSRLPSDFELRAGGRSFPVHRLVLGARSPVFRAMFDSDMLERSQGTLELTDLDAETAERLLRFAYADADPPPDLPRESLVSLYAAADKYQIPALWRICAERLVKALDPVNAPEILQLADRHRDAHLKEDVIEYVFKRGRAVLESDRWKDLERDDPQLAAETLRRIFCEKVLAQPIGATG